MADRMNNQDLDAYKIIVNNGNVELHIETTEYGHFIELSPALARILASGLLAAAEALGPMPDLVVEGSGIHWERR